MFVLRTNHTFVLRINLVVLRITTRGVLSVIFDSLQVSIDPRHARCPNLNPFDPGRFPYFPDGTLRAALRPRLLPDSHSIRPQSLSNPKIQFYIHFLNSIFSQNNTVM